MKPSPAVHAALLLLLTVVPAVSGYIMEQERTVRVSKWTGLEFTDIIDSEGL